MPVVDRLFSSEAPEERNSKVVLGKVAIKKDEEGEGDGENSDIDSSSSLTDKSDSDDNDLLMAVDADEVQQINRDVNNVSLEYEQYSQDDKELFKNIETN